MKCTWKLWECQKHQLEKEKSIGKNQQTTPAVFLIQVQPYS